MDDLFVAQKESCLTFVKHYDTQRKEMEVQSEKCKEAWFHVSVI